MDRSRARTREVYDEIADHFSETRAYPWPEVEAFLDDCGDLAGDGSVGLDVGCGNGRHTAPLLDCVDRAVGVDASSRLLAVAREEVTASDVEFVAGDAARLPVRDDCADLALYVATLHHLPTRETRIESLDELARVLASGGRGLVSAWSTAHDRFDREEGFDTIVDWTLPGGETVPRFYHVYDPEEFEADLETSRLRCLEWELSSGNCYATVASGNE